MREDEEVGEPRRANPRPGQDQREPVGCPSGYPELPKPVETDHESYKAQAHRLDKVKVGLEALTLLAVVAYAVIAFWQWDQMSNQWNEAANSNVAVRIARNKAAVESRDINERSERIANAAKTSADAAKAGLDQNQKNFAASFDETKRNNVNAQRAWVTIRRVNRPILPLIGTIRIPYSLENYGRTPAFVSLACRVEITRQSESLPFQHTVFGDVVGATLVAPNIPGSGACVIEPGDPMRSRFTPPVIAGIESGAHTMWVWALSRIKMLSVFPA